MKRAATVALAIGALVGAAAQPVSAQVIIGGSAEPSVEVNWAVLDRLGPTPTLPDMLKADVPLNGMRAKLAPSGTKVEAITFRPYQEKAKAAPVRRAQPVVAQAAPKSEKAPKVATEKPAKPAPETDVAVGAKGEPLPPAKIAALQPEPAKAAPAAGPVVSLPETPVAAPAPMPPIKVEPAVSPDPAKPEIPAIAAAKPETAPVAPVVAEAKPESLAPPTVLAKVEPAPAPAPVAVPVATPAPAPSPVPAAVAETASLPPAAPAPAVSSEGDTLTIAFASENSRLPEDARARLSALAAKMEKNDGLGLQLLAYAEGTDATASKARRLSLSRALEVRKFLMDQGIRSTRIEVRALGTKNDGGPADRVDAVLIAR